MLEKEFLEYMLGELKREHQHQLEFVKRLSSFHKQLSKESYAPLDLLEETIAKWSGNISKLGKRIQELEKEFPKKTV